MAKRGHSPYLIFKDLFAFRIACSNEASVSSEIIPGNATEMQQRILPIHSLASGKEKQLSKPRTPKLSLLIQEVYSSTVWYTSSESTVSLTAFGSLRSWGCWNMRGLRFWRTRLRVLLEEERRPLPKSIDKGGIDVADFWEPCPRCGSKHVQTWSYWRSIMLMIPLAFGGCLFLLAGALFWPLWVVAGVLLLMAPLSFLPLFVKLKICKTCKLMWNPKKMKQAL